MNKSLRIFVPCIVACLMVFFLIYMLGSSSHALASGDFISKSWVGKEVTKEVDKLHNNLLVNTLQDELNSDGDCSLREAISAANTNTSVDACGTGDVLTDTITFNVAGTITLTNQISVIAGGPLVINGGDVITTSGGGTTRVWWVETGSVLTMQNLSVTDGSIEGSGAGLYNNAASVTIVHSQFIGNRLLGDGYFGGAIYSLEGTLVVNDSLFNENGLEYITGRVYGGGIAIQGGMGVIIRSILQNNTALGECDWFFVPGGGGIYVSSASLNIQESNFSNNQDLCNGGGIAIESGAVILADSTMSGNYSNFGGAICNASGTVTVINSTLSDNIASNPTIGSHGGAILNYGTVAVTNSTLSGNSSENTGGAIANYGTMTVTNSTLSGNSSGYSGGAILNSGTITMSNSTLSGNSADTEGGAILNYGTMMMNNSTVSNNSALNGGGIAGTAVLTNSIIANSLSGGDCSAPITDGGHNISSDDTCGLDPANGSMPNTDPLLGPLQDNGGSTWTHALLPGSPAIDAGDDTQCPPTDQRGVIRPQDGNGDGEAVCDIGSYELGPGQLIVTTLDDIVDPEDELCSLREALQTANTNTFMEDCGTGDVLTDTITFDVAGTITVTSQLSVTAGGPLVIDGGDIITTSGGGTTRVWWVETGSELTLQRIAVGDGFVVGSGAGLFNNGADVIIDQCEFIGNIYSGEAVFGGGIYAGGGTINVIDSHFQDNRFGPESLGSGGGIAFKNATGFILRSNFLNNAGHGSRGIPGGGGIILEDSSVTIKDSSFISNTSVHNGGGIAIGYNSSLTITNTIISGNTSGFGGGIANIGSLTIINSTLSGNSAFNGGAIVNYGTMTISDSTLSGNSANSGGGGIATYDGSMNIYNSTLSGNSAEALGGGIYNEGGNLTAINSTLSGNSADFNGGGIATYLGSMNIFNSTLSGNSAEAGGGIYNLGNHTAINSIVANSPSGGDCYFSLTDGGHNISSDDSCGFDPANSSMPNTDPLLGPLQDNGGPTWTHALLPDSPAIDAGDDAQCPPTDQRGVYRPQDGNGDGEAVCDIGSYELEGPPVPPAIVTIAGASEGIVGPVVYFTATVEPVSTTLPIEYVWWASGHPPITETRGLTDTVGWAWETPGTYAITVTASNFGGSVSDTHVFSLTDQPIEGLTASNDSPTLLGEVTTLTGTITSGTNVIFTWDFGDDLNGSGGTITHTYTIPGVYTATVTATNSVGSLTETTLVSITTPIYPIYLPLVIKSNNGILTPTQPSSFLGDGEWMGLTILGIVSMWKRRG